MSNSIKPIRRIILVTITLAVFAFSMSISPLFLSLLSQWVNTKVQALIFTVIIDLIWMTIMAVIYRRMNHLLRDMLDGVFSMISKNALICYGMLILFGFGIGIVLNSSVGLIIYAVFG